MKKMTNSSPPNFFARHRARRLALQALYQWLLSGNNLQDIEIESHRFNNMQKIDVSYFHELLYDIPKQLPQIDALFEPYLDRSIHELNPIELTVLRIASYELSFRPDIPYRVVLNEALELAKSFGAEEGYKYVNAVLDKVCRKLRVVEMKQGRADDPSS